MAWGLVLSRFAVLMTYGCRAEEESCFKTGSCSKDDTEGQTLFQAKRYTEKSSFEASDSLLIPTPQEDDNAMSLSEFEASDSLLIPTPQEHDNATSLLDTGVVSGSDPMCKSGILKGHLKNGACCPVSCGQCGGPGCGRAPGGKAQCCSNDVKKLGISCHSNMPPCVTSVLKPSTPAPTAPAPPAVEIAWKCESWCDGNNNSWDVKCAWHTRECGSCRKCRDFYQCAPWCASNPAALKAKCGWKACSGCDGCPGVPPFEKGPPGFVKPLADAPNMRSGLVPPAGTMWRGASHWVVPMSSNYNPAEFKYEFGVPLHIFRTFKHGSNYQFTKGEIAHISSGGIIWYGFQPTNWKDAADGKIDALITSYALTVAAVAPAQVMVCPGWEPDGHAAPYAHGHELFGTTADYVRFYEHTVKMFKKHGASNAVFIIDYSAKTEFHEGVRSIGHELIPDGGLVQWFFFNMFQVRDERVYKRGTARGKPQPHWDSREHLKFWDTLLKSEKWSPKVKDIPWGLGAWGTTYEMGIAPPGQKTKFEDRVFFVNEVTNAINTGMYPNLKASIYFDSLSSIITPLDIEITQVGDIARNNAIIKYYNSAEMVPTFKKYLEAAPFMANDASVKLPEGITFSAHWSAEELAKWKKQIVSLSKKYSDMNAGIKFVEARYKEAVAGGYLDPYVCASASSGLMTYFDPADPTWCVKAEMVNEVVTLNAKAPDTTLVEGVLAEENPHSATKKH